MSSGAGCQGQGRRIQSEAESPHDDGWCVTEETSCLGRPSCNTDTGNKQTKRETVAISKYYKTSCLGRPSCNTDTGNKQRKRLSQLVNITKSLVISLDQSINFWFNTITTIPCYNFKFQCLQYGSEMQLHGRASTHCVKVCWINHSWWSYQVIHHFSQCSTTCVTKAMVYTMPCVIVHIKDPLLLIRRVAYKVVAGFFSCYLNSFFTTSLTPYNCYKLHLIVAVWPRVDKLLLSDEKLRKR